MSDTCETLVREFPPRVICTEQEYERANRIELSRRVREDLMLDPVDASDFPSPRPADYELLSRRAWLTDDEIARFLREQVHKASGEVVPIGDGPAGGDAPPSGWRDRPSLL